MKFTELDIEHFLAIKTAKLRLADRGLLLIQGVNDDDPSADSNGAGKSSVADALCWCIFGTTARGVSGDAVINREVGKGTVVRASIEDGADLYRVIRHRKHKEGKNALQLHKLADDGTVTDLTKGTDKLTQIEVERVVGCSYEVFKAAVYAGQEQMPDLPAMADKALKELVEEAAGITVLEAAYELARANGTSAKVELDRTVTEIDKITALSAEAVRRVGEVKEQRREFEERRATAVATMVDLAVTAQRKAVDLTRQVADTDKPGLEARYKVCSDRLAAVSGERIEERRLIDALGVADRTVARLAGEANALAAQAKRDKTAIDSITGRVGAPCGECGKAYEEGDIAEAKKRATAKLRATVAQHSAIRIEHGSAVDARNSLSSALDEHRASMSDVSSLSALSDEISDSLEAINELIRLRDSHDKEAANHRDRAEEKKAEPNPFDAAIMTAEARVVTLDGTLARLRASEGDQRGTLELAEAAVKVFGPAGVRAHILDTVTPFLNERTASYLGTLSDGHITASWSTLSRTAKGELREKFCIDVDHAKGGASFAALSGGEKRKVRVATALALQDLVASRAIKPIELFFGDEIDDALDFAGLERLMDVLQEKAKERGSVVVISHNALTDWIRTSITVRKCGGSSVLEDAA